MLFRSLKILNESVRDSLLFTLPIFKIVDESRKEPVFFENLSFIVGLEFTTTFCENEFTDMHKEMKRNESCFFITTSVVVKLVGAI